jgi:hypothetical protein
MQLLDQGSRARLTKLATWVRRLATDFTFDSVECSDASDGLASDGGVARDVDLWPRLVSGFSSFNSDCPVSRATPSRLAPKKMRRSFAVIAGEKLFLLGHQHGVWHPDPNEAEKP